jgi:hypothetical protein
VVGFKIFRKLEIGNCWRRDFFFCSQNFLGTSQASFTGSGFFRKSLVRIV